MIRINSNWYMKVIIFSIILVIFVSLSFVSVYAQSKHLSIVTAGATGTYYPIGSALAKVINDNIPNIYAVAEVSGGSVENIKLVSRGEADIGIANQMHFRKAIPGTPPFDKPITNLRTLFPLAGTNYVMKHAWQVIVHKNSPIESIYDLKQKKVAVGPAGSGTEVYSKNIFDTLFENGYEAFTPLFYSYTEATSAMQDGTINACIFHSAAPTGAIIELAASRDIRMIPIDDVDIAKLKEAWGFNKRVVTPSEYKWLEEEVDTVVASYHTIFVNKDADEEMIYNIVKAAMENKENIWVSNPGAKGYDEQGVVIGLDNPPLHEGSYKYFEEVGIDIPENAVPPELK